MICVIVTCSWRRCGGSETGDRLECENASCAPIDSARESDHRLGQLQGAAKKVALPEFATQGHQALDLAGLFDALRNNLLVKLHRQSEDQVHRVVTHAVREQVVNEGLVDP